MKQPKVYVKSLDKVFEVESIRFDTKVVEVYDEEESILLNSIEEEVNLFKSKNGIK